MFSNHSELSLVAPGSCVDVIASFSTSLEGDASFSPAKTALSNFALAESVGSSALLEEHTAAWADLAPCNRFELTNASLTLKQVRKSSFFGFFFFLFNLFQNRQRTARSIICCRLCAPTGPTRSVREVESSTSFTLFSIFQNKTKGLASNGYNGHRFED